LSAPLEGGKSKPALSPIPPSLPQITQSDGLFPDRPWDQGSQSLNESIPSPWLLRNVTFQQLVCTVSAAIGIDNGQDRNPAQKEIKGLQIGFLPLPGQAKHQLIAEQGIQKRPLRPSIIDLQLPDRLNKKRRHRSSMPPLELNEKLAQPRFFLS
jgi:hypothetical protein